MPTRSILGPDFEDFTMTSENFRWLHSCRWEPAHFLAFTKLRIEFPQSFGKAPNLVKSKILTSPLTSARWLLVDNEGMPIAWAELQTYPVRHDLFGILMWGRAEEKTDNFDNLHMTRFISFCFIVGKFDHMKIATLQARESTILQGIGTKVGELRRTYVLKERSWFPSTDSPLIEILSLELARDEWVASPISDPSNKTLQFVSSRVSRFEKAQSMVAPQQKRRSFLARLLRPKINDSIF